MLDLFSTGFLVFLLWLIEFVVTWQDAIDSKWANGAVSGVAKILLLILMVRLKNIIHFILHDGLSISCYWALTWFSETSTVQCLIVRTSHAKYSSLKCTLVNTDFQIGFYLADSTAVSQTEVLFSNVASEWHSHQPIRHHVRRSLRTDMGFDMDFPSISTALRRDFCP